MIMLSGSLKFSNICTLNTVILSEAKDLANIAAMFSQILRFAQDDSGESLPLLREIN
jgi:hypothetical protein